MCALRARAQKLISEKFVFIKTNNNNTRLESILDCVNYIDSNHCNVCARARHSQVDERIGAIISAHSSGATLCARFAASPHLFALACGHARPAMNL